MATQRRPTHVRAGVLTKKGRKGEQRDTAKKYFKGLATAKAKTTAKAKAKANIYKATGYPLLAGELGKPKTRRTRTTIHPSSPGYGQSVRDLFGSRQQLRISGGLPSGMRTMTHTPAQERTARQVAADKKRNAATRTRVAARRTRVAARKRNLSRGKAARAKHPMFR